MPEAQDQLKLFKFYGVVINEEQNGHGIGDCPFCGKENHFFINKETQCWDCKVCGEADNEYGFLNRIFNINLGNTEPRNIHQLAVERRLPLDIFANYQIAYRQGKYYLPFYNEYDKICNIGIYSFGKKLLNSPRVPISIFNLQHLYDIEREKEFVYLCAGPWDAIALDYTLKKLNKPGIALGFPGENSFRKNWIDYFIGKDVIVCYDNDDAGLKGSQKVKDYIGSVVNSIKYLCWPKEYKSGYDVRDLVIVGTKSDLNYTFFTLHSNIKECTPLEFRSKQLEIDHAKKNESGQTDLSIEIEEYTLYEDVIAEFKKYLEVDSDFEDAIKLALATVVSPKIPGKNPLWLFLVGPPGCGKTEILESFMEAKKYTEFQSTLSSTALISGWIGKGKGTAFDPSLIPKLNGKTLVLKDFTEIIKKNPLERDTIFSILRGAYDGQCERSFGQGVKREYKSKFAIVAGVTREIYANSTANVGERFLKYNMVPKRKSNEFNIQKRAMDSALFGEEIKESVIKIVHRFLNNNFDVSPSNLREMLPGWFIDKVIPLANLIAAFRTQVIRYEKGQLQYEPIYKPDVESGNRLSVQFQRLGLALALVENKVIDHKIYDLVKKVAIYTVNDYTIDIIRSLIKQEKPIDIKKMEEITKLSYMMVKAYVADMLLLNILEKQVQMINGKPNFTYFVRPSIRQMYLDAEL